MNGWTWAWYEGKEIEVDCPELEKARRWIRELESEVDDLRHKLEARQREAYDIRDYE